MLPGSRYLYNKIQYWLSVSNHSLFFVILYPRVDMSPDCLWVQRLPFCWDNLSSLYSPGVIYISIFVGTSFTLCYSWCPLTFTCFFLSSPVSVSVAVCYPWLILSPIIRYSEDVVPPTPFLVLVSTFLYFPNRLIGCVKPVNSWSPECSRHSPVLPRALTNLISLEKSDHRRSPRVVLSVPFPHDRIICDTNHWHELLYHTSYLINDNRDLSRPHVLLHQPHVFHVIGTADWFMWLVLL